MIFTQLRNKWKDILIGESLDKPLTEYEIKVTETIDHCVTGYYETLCQEINREYLWEEESDFTQSQKQTNNYGRLFEMCKAYSMEHSKYYRNKELLEVIQEALRFLYNINYNTNRVYYYGNWWNWEIGSPIVLLNIMTLLGDALEEEERQRYCEVIRYYQPNPRKSGERAENPKIKRRTSVGGNRVDTSKIAILLGIHTKDKDLIHEGKDALSDVFKVVDYTKMGKSGEKRDGIYKDWSFIQHGDVAYTGTYGNVMLGGLGELNYLLNGTEFEVTDPQIETIYQMIDKSFIPIIYKGHGMDCVNGRGATRQKHQNNGTGYAIITSILWFCQFAPESYRRRYASRIKYWLLSDKVSSYIETINNIVAIRMALEILENEAIEVATPLIGNFAYNYMDRMIHHTKYFTCALSMSSHRIRTYEIMLGENKKGFYTGDGMLWIYTDNQEEYNQDFWATINPYKLTGTTIVEKALEDGAGYYRPCATWVSAMSIQDCYGIAGMQLDKRGINDETGEVEASLGIDLKAKKSYFMLDEEIVALGCDICATNEERVITIVDTRKMRKDTGYKIYNEEDSLYLEADTEEKSIGYYFLEEQEVEVETYTQEGSWYEVNTNGTKHIKKQEYVTVAINHGNKPCGERYAYIMLPGISRERLKVYKQSLPIRVIANTEYVQGIEYGNKWMANFFGECELQGMKVSEPVSIVMIENEQTIEIAVSDPSKENNNLLKITLNQQVQLNEAYPYVSIGYKGEKSIVTIDWTPYKGQCVKFVLKK